MALSTRPGKKVRAALVKACKASGIRVGDWAASHNVSRQHLYAVIAGERESPRLSFAVSAYIASHRSHKKGRAA